MTIRALVFGLLIAFALLAWIGSAHAGILWFAGAEVGSGAEATTFSNCTAQTGTVIHGAYSYRCTTGGNIVSKTGLGLATGYARFYWRVSTGTGQLDNVIIRFCNGTCSVVGDTGTIWLRTHVSDSKWIFGFNSGTIIATSSGTWSLDTTYLMEVKAVVGVSGGLELKACAMPCGTLSEVVEISSFVTNTTSMTSIDRVAWDPFQGGAGHNEIFFYDDLIISDSGYIGAGIDIARQGTSGTPTYDTWTKTSCTGGTIDGCWSDTPFSAASNASTSTGNDAQTMVVHSFATTQSGHGAETTANAASLNVCKTALVGKTGSASNMTIRRRLAGSDTDTAVALTTTAAT